MKGGGLMSPAEVQEILEWERLEEQADFTEAIMTINRHAWADDGSDPNV